MKGYQVRNQKKGPSGAGDGQGSGGTRARLQAVQHDDAELSGVSPSAVLGDSLHLRVHSVKIEPATQSASASIEMNVSLRTTDARVAEIDQSFDPWTSTAEDAAAFGGIGSPEFGAWAAASLIEGNRGGIEADGAMLLGAIDMLMSYRLRPPAWLAVAYRRRFGPFETFEARSLDEAFGIEPLTERMRRAKQLRHEKTVDVHRALVEAIRAEPDRAIDNELFEEIGEAFGIGRTVCREIYDFAVKEHGLQDLVELKRLIAFGRDSTPGS